jgi:hypothetical protein
MKFKTALPALLLALALVLPAQAQIMGSQLPMAFPSSGDSVIAIQNGTTVQENLGNISSFVGSNNVSSFDARTGAVTLLTTDISTALGFTPLSTTGNGSGLTGLTYSQLPELSANELLGALTATTPSGLAVPSCSAASDALNWTSGTGPGCNTSVATSGANSDITSLTGLTTALSIAQGGTHGTTAAGALSNLAGNPAAGTYALDCTTTALCGTVSIGAGPFASLAGSSSQAFSVAPATTATGAPQSQQTVGGVGTSYVNQTANRTLNTTFTNSTGGPIFVMAEVELTVANSTVGPMVNGVALPGFSNNANTAAIEYAVTFVVPMAETYEVATSSGGTIAAWFELEQ